MVKIRNYVFRGLIPVTQLFLYVSDSNCFLFSSFMREMVTKTKHSLFISFMDIEDLRNVIHIIEFQVENGLAGQTPSFL